MLAPFRTNGPTIGLRLRFIAKGCRTRIREDIGVVVHGEFPLGETVLAANSDATMNPAEFPPMS